MIALEVLKLIDVMAIGTEEGRDFLTSGVTARTVQRSDAWGVAPP
jgi:hypothetical protein